LSPPAPGQTTWTESVIYSFKGKVGNQPRGSLILDSAGDLYGTTFKGGLSAHGAVFELTPPAAGERKWTETDLTAFNKTNGEEPAGSLIFDKTGNLYGTASAGGAHNAGTVFEVTP